jgi:alpha-ketoglutarate-dependent 2,4-dichlorophenoxyacetate dioxygenase
MPLQIKPLHPLFAAELFGANLHAAPSDELIEAVEEAMAQYAVVAIRDQHIDDDEQIRFSRAFGPLELPPHMGLKPASGQTFQHRIRAEMYDVSNLDGAGRFLPAESLRHSSNRANEEFHTDSSFNALPTKWSLLSARIVPPVGADTLYVDTRAVYDALPADLKIRAEAAVAEHDFWNTRGRAGFGEVSDAMRHAMPPVPQAVVRVVPESSRKALLIGNHATHILGWPLAEGRRFLQQLNAFATQTQFVYRHRWRAGDLVIWDNRCTIHCATAYDLFKYKRDLRRTTINEFGPETSSTDALGIPPTR